MGGVGYGHLIFENFKSVILYFSLSNIFCSDLFPVLHVQINGSLARRAIKDLMARGSIRMISAHSSQQIYTRATNT